MRTCEMCHKPIASGKPSINGRHYRCHVEWCEHRDAQLRGDPEFFMEYWGDA